VRLGTDHTRVLIEVWDVIAGAPVTGQAGPDDESGRGLVLVEAVCERWSWETVPGWPGKVVWAELHIQLLLPCCGNFHEGRGPVSGMSGASAGSR